jgi:hypothetical protein
MKVSKEFNVKYPVLLLKSINGGNLAIIDSKASVRIISLSSYKVVAGFKADIEHDRLIGCHVAIDDSAKVCASILPKKSQSAIYSIGKKSLLFQTGRHQGEVESITIDPMLKYFVTGGSDGKTFAWSLKNSRFAFSVRPHKDYVTTIAFSANGQWVATGSFDRDIHVMNLATMKKASLLRAHGSPVIKVLFLPKHRIVSAEKDGAVFVWDVESSKVIERMKRVNDDITTMTLSDDQRFLFVGTKLGYIALYDMQTYTQLSSRLIKERDSISSLAFIQSKMQLCVGTPSGVVKIFNLIGDESQYEKMVEDKDFSGLHHECEKNPLLLFIDATKKMNDIWDKAILNANKLLELHKESEADAILTPFKAINEKNKIIQEMFKNYKQYLVFKKYLDENRYNLAYPMILKYPSFKTSMAYTKVEKEWKSSFTKAKELILKKNGEDEAKKLMEKFRGVSDKAILINQLFKEREKYTYFKDLIVKKEYKKIFELVKQHPFLQEFSEYDALEEFADKLYIKAYQVYSSGDFISAEKLSLPLLNFPDYVEDAQEMLATIRTKSEFFKSIENNDIASAFKHMSNFPMLYDTDAGIKLEDEWNKNLDIAATFISKGEVNKAVKGLVPYVEVENKFEAMAVLFKQLYMRQMDAAIAKDLPQDKIENAIKRYISIFGVDDFVVLVFESLKKRNTSALDLESLPAGDIELWKPAMAFASIFS